MKEQERQTSRQSLVSVRRGRFVKAPFVPGGAGPAQPHGTAWPGCPQRWARCHCGHQPRGAGSTTPALCPAAAASPRVNPFEGMVEEIPGRGCCAINAAHTQHQQLPAARDQSPFSYPQNKLPAPDKRHKHCVYPEQAIHSGHKIGFKTRYCRHFSPCAHTVLGAAPGAAPTFGNHCTTELKPHPSSIGCPFDEQISHALNLLSLTWLALQSPGL